MLCVCPATGRRWGAVPWGSSVQASGVLSGTSHAGPPRSPWAAQYSVMGFFSASLSWRSSSSQPRMLTDKIYYSKPPAFQDRLWCSRDTRVLRWQTVCVCVCDSLPAPMTSAGTRPADVAWISTARGLVCSAPFRPFFGAGWKSQGFHAPKVQPSNLSVMTDRHGWKKYPSEGYFIYIKYFYIKIIYVLYKKYPL